MGRLAVKTCAALAGLAAAPAHADVFVDVGAQTSRVKATFIGTPSQTSSAASMHLGVGVRRDVGERSSIGARLDVDEIDSDLLLGVRAFDYAYHFSERLAATAFVGAARLDLPTPAYGYYFGAGVLLKDVMPSWDLGVELRLSDELARDNLLPNDPRPGFADFFDVTSFSVYLSYRF